MPFNGNGVYSAPSLPGSFNPAISGQAATPTDWNTLLTDLSTALSTTLTKDGQSTPTANIGFGGFRITNVGNASALTDATTAGQVQNARHTYAIDTGSSTAYAIAPAPACSAYAVGQRFQFKAVNTNTTTTPTLAVSGLTAGTIVMADGSAIAVGAIVAGGVYEVAVSAATPVFQFQSLTQVLPAASTATTQAQANNSTKLATTAYVDRVAVQQYVITTEATEEDHATTIPYDDTIPQSGEGSEYFTVTITPKSATSKLLINVEFNCTITDATQFAIVALFQDAGADALKAVGAGFVTSGGSVSMETISFTYEKVSGTTSATTFKVRAGTGGGTQLTMNGAGGSRLFGGVCISFISVTEIGI